MDQLLPEFGNHPIIRLIWDAGWLFYQMGSGKLSTSRILQETVDIWMLQFLWSMLAWTGFSVSSGSQPLQKILQKVRGMENMAMTLMILMLLMPKAS